MASSNGVELFGVWDELLAENLQYLDVLKRGAEALQKCVHIYSSNEFQTKNGWKKELVNGDVSVYSTNIEHGRLFNMQVNIFTAKFTT